MDNFLLIAKYRRENEAPVDFIGCNSFYVEDIEGRKLLILMALILSSRTRDEAVYRAMRQIDAYLRNKKYNNEIEKNFIFSHKFTIKNLIKISPEKLKNLIRGVGFFSQKTKFLLDLFKNYENKKLPETYEEVITLRGVGEKVALLYLQHACENFIAISVDSHVHRIANIIGLIKSKNEKESSKLLTKLFFNKEIKYDVNKILVGFGQTICTKKKPKCNLCCINLTCKKNFDF